MKMEEINREYCKNNCKGYQESGVCFVDGTCGNYRTHKGISPLEKIAAEAAGLCDSCLDSNGIPDRGCGECESKGYYCGYLRGVNDEQKRIHNKLKEMIKTSYIWNEGKQYCIVDVDEFEKD